MELGADPWIPSRGVGSARPDLYRRTASARTADRSRALRQPWLPRGQRGGLRPEFRVRRAAVLPYALSTELPWLLAAPGRTGIPYVLGDPRDSRLIRGPAVVPSEAYEWPYHRYCRTPSNRDRSGARLHRLHFGRHASDPRSQQYVSR